MDEKDTYLYRVEEKVNDITIITKSVSARPSQVVADDVRQTFTVKYKRPFKGSNVQDVNLQVRKEYNLTSYYGCYTDDSANVFGSDPDVLFKAEEPVPPAADPTADPVVTPPVGCKSRW